MADKPMTDLRVRKSFKYMSRMMRAGDDVTMPVKHAEFWTKIGAVEPKRAPKANEAARSTVETVDTPAPKPATKAPAKRRATRRKKSA
jgi:hypothetical protein